MFLEHTNQLVRMISEGSCDTETGVMMLNIHAITGINCVANYI